MKLRLVLAIAFVFGLMASMPLSAYEGHDHGASQMNSKYECPMHPDVQSDKPGKCPKCEMDLVKVTQGESAHKH